MSTPATYKPSPLSFGSPRSSPFRRPESPAASPSTVRGPPTTPTPSPRKPHTPAQSPGKAGNSWTPRGLATPPENGQPPSPTRTQARAMGGVDGGDALSKLSGPQVRELREGYQLLDRDSDGHVGREDVVDMLNNLGQDSAPSATSSFFPPGAPQTLSLAQYLTQLSGLLAPLSPPEELLSAFAAFDEDDGGQVDVAELRDALLHTSAAPGERGLSEREVDRVVAGFTARRAFGKKGGAAGGARGEVFKYQDFVAAISGGGSVQQGEKN
ncbi:MAG: hypothetical protein M1832_002242 [Thelocarpon impressellum]|nr:MAG: hypothetical protein M1832_002242 [Thelocarpon impressellum]